MYNDLYGSTYATESIAAGTAMLGLGFGIIIFSLILSLILIISNWKIFTKAGKPGWASIVPIYNTIVMIEIAKLPLWYIALFFIPVANIYAMFKIYIEIAKKFGKSSGFGIGMALLSIIFIPLLAFSDSVYEDNNKTETNNTNSFDASSVINNNVENNVLNTENTINTIEKSIPTMPVVEPEINIEPATTTAQVVEPTVNNNVIEPSIPTIPVEETTTNIVEPPVLNEQVINPEPTIIVEEPQVNNVELVTPVSETKVASTQVIETSEAAPVSTQNVETTQEPVIPTLEPEIVTPTSIETSNNITNAFNSAPIITDTITNSPIQESETVLNQAPVINSVVEEPVSKEINPETVKENIEQVGTLKKVCKNCGVELPEIVSICPSCGTDNE